LRSTEILAHGYHGREGVVVAVAAARGVASAAERLDGLLGLLARNEPHAEEAQHSVGVEDGGAVDLCEGVAERSKVRGRADLQRRRRRQPLLDCGTGRWIGPVDEQ
jgi:hypothetical protein